MAEVRYDELNSRDSNNINRRQNIAINCPDNSSNDMEKKNEEDSIIEVASWRKYSIIQFIEKSKNACKIITPIVILVIFNICYLVSLSGCPIKPLNKNLCLDWLKSFGPILAFACCTAAISMSLLIILAFHNVVHCIWLFIALINIFAMYLYDGDTNFKNHGFFNRMILVFTIISILVLYATSRCAIFVCRKGKFYILAMCGCIFVLTLIVYIKLVVPSCNCWTKGIGSSALNVDSGDCTIYVPKYCELSIRDGWFDLNKFTKQCKDVKMAVDKSRFSSSLQHRVNVRRIGYPRVENYPYSAVLNESQYQHRVLSEVIDMDDPDISQTLKDNIEFVIDLTNDNDHLLTVQLKKNETRAQEAKDIRQKVIEQDKLTNNTDRIDKDVLIFYMDNISRVHFHRKMKKLDKWLNQYADELDTAQQQSDSKQSDSNTSSDNSKLSQQNTTEYKAFEYFRYHAISRETALNTNGMYYGTNDFLETESEYIFHYFKNNGYVIGSFADECEFDPVYNDTRAFNQSFVTFDNYGGSIACDMNYDSTLEMDIVLDKGRNSQYRRCLYGQEMHNIQLNYIKQFWNAYQGNRKAFRSRFNENHEATGELIKYNDNDAVEFLEYFKANGYLKDTIIYFISDHGQHFIVGHIPFVPDDSRLEENYLPLLIVLVPIDVHEQNLNYLRQNQQHFVNGIDVYSSFKSIAVGKRATANELKSYSIMHEELPLKRDCEKSSEGIKYTNCWCSLDHSYIQNKAKERLPFYIEF